jgi:hypothetical protein
MENSLLTEISTDEILAEAGMMGRSLGMPLNNPGGHESAAKGRAGERDWVQGLAKDKKNIASTFRDSTQGGNPTMTPRAEAQAGDFVVVAGKPTKIRDVKQMYGNDSFAYLEGQQKPIITSRLELAKRVGKINVFKIK